MIRKAMIEAGYTRMTVLRYLPAEAKAKPPGDNNKMLQTQSQRSGYQMFQTQQMIEEIKSEDYRTEDLEQYSHTFLIEIIHYLERQLKLNLNSESSESKQYQSVIKQVEHETKQQAKNYYSPQAQQDSERSQIINECVTILSQTNEPIVFEDLLKQAVNGKPTLHNYLGPVRDKT